MTATARRASEPPEPPVSPGDRTDRRLRTAILVLALIGTGVAAYLTYVHYEGLKVLCLSSGGCETVQASRYAKLDGVPVALLGLLGYLALLGSLLVRGELGRVAGFAVALIGFGFSMYLTYREIFTIKAICQWCVSSAVLMTLLAILTAVRAARYEPADV
ncbi:MAG TPA: vitamin K epoxide reductase family protein [Solirubrobacteraceae bacterium]|nr:vitamin K epoxide reductase family protein [Solirubrobacteraceae bacterium]